MPSTWYTDTAGDGPLAAWVAQDSRAWSLEADSAPVAVIRERLALGLQQLRRPEPLTAAFGHVAGAIGAAYPFAVVLPETEGISITQAGISEPLPGQINQTGVLQTQDIALVVGVVVGPTVLDWARMTNEAERWLLPLTEFFSQNRSLGQTCVGCLHTGFTYDDWVWAGTHYFMLAAHIIARAQYRLRAH